MPQVSVIVPVYNVEEKLRRCLDSLVKQSFTDFEVVLVDDGSSDDSGVICDEYADMNQKFRVIHQSNAGVSAARNNGIEHSLSSYITFVDSDDYVQIDYLQSLVEKLSSNKELIISGVFFCREGTDSCNSQKNEGDYELRISQENADKINDLIQDRRFNYVYAKLYSADIIRKNDIRFDETVFLGEDTLFVMDYIWHISSCFIVGNAYYYYVRYASGTLTGRFYPNIYQMYTAINETMEQTFKGKGINVERTIDVRQLDSARWAIGSIRNEVGIEQKEKTYLIDRIVNSDRLQAALNKENLPSAEFPEYNIMKNRSGKKLLAYYKRTEAIEKLDSAIRVFVVKIVPRRVIRRVKNVCRMLNHHSSV